MYNEEQLITMKDVRNEMIEREDVFNDSRVKALASFLLPKDFGATTQQVADYFEVGSISAIKSLIKDNRDELEENGLRLTTKDELSSLKELGCVSKNSGNINIFTRRTILNVAMLLRDSEVAKTIRSVLLDATENKIVVKEIIKDNQEDFKDLLFAVYNGGQDAIVASKKITEIEIQKATKPLLDDIKLKDDTIKYQQNDIQMKTDIITGFTDDIDIYTKRDIVNRIIKRSSNGDFSGRYKEMYKCFRETFSIDLEARCKGYNLKQTKKKDKLSTIKYAEKFNHIDGLYQVACKLYHTEIQELLEELGKTIN